MKNKTIIYYTSNLEDDLFEAKIRQKLLETGGGLPIVSVSHKPLNFGKNICIGVKKPSNVLIYYQLLLGCREAKTPYVINAEADFLYPPDYFNFDPTDKNTIYRYNNIRVLDKNRWGFFRKGHSEGAQIVSREYLIALLEKKLPKNIDESQDDLTFHPYTDKGLVFVDFGSDNPCITFKTESRLHNGLNVEKEHSKPVVPYWGTAENLRREMFNL